MNQSTEINDNTTTEPIEQSSVDIPKRTNWILAIVGVVLLLVSSAMLYYSIGSYARGALAQSYKAGDAIVSKIEEHYDPIGVRKEVQLTFKTDKAEHTANVEMPTDRVMKKGELTAIWYDANNPSNAVLSQSIDYDSIIILGAFGLFMFCFGASITWSQFAQK